MNNSDPVLLIGHLKGMFPNFDDEILVSAIFQNGGNVEKTIDCLLALQADSGFSKFSNNNNTGKELSLFNNINSNNSQVAKK
jgi:hypothetical protein